MASATSPYVAQVRLRWEDGFIQPGEPVPADTGRNYQLMLAQGEIVFAGSDDGNQTRPREDQRPHAGSQKSEQAQRAARSSTAHKK